MFIEHNKATWNEPAEFEFEPSMVWHDTDEIVVDEPAQIFLRNMMTKSRRSLEEVRPELEKKRKEVEGLKTRKDEVKLDESKGQIDADVTRVSLDYPPKISVASYSQAWKLCRLCSTQWKNS